MHAPFDGVPASLRQVTVFLSDAEILDEREAVSFGRRFGLWAPCPGRKPHGLDLLGRRFLNVCWNRHRPTKDADEVNRAGNLSQPNAGRKSSDLNSIRTYRNDVISVSLQVIRHRIAVPRRIGAGADNGHCPSALQDASVKSLLPRHVFHSVIP